MTGKLNHIKTDAEFQPHLTNAGSKLVVADFFATWYVYMGDNIIFEGSLFTNTEYEVYDHSRNQLETTGTPIR